MAFLNNRARPNNGTSILANTVTNMAGGNGVKKIDVAKERQLMKKVDYEGGVKNNTCIM